MLAAALVFAYYLAFELSTIRLAEPMGTWETIYASIARVWPHEYQAGNFVAGHDNYGPGYPAFCRPFICAFADIYVAHRVANLVALATACLVLAGILRLNGCSRVGAFAIVAIFFAVNAGTYSVQARPDFLVMLEVTAIMALGELALRGRLNPVAFGLLLGALGAAAYLTKPYALFAWGGAVAGLSLSGKHRLALAGGALSAAIMLAGVGAYAAANRFYLLETFQAHLEHAEADADWLAHQSWDFAVLACGPLVAAAVAGLQGLVHAGEARAPASARPVAARYWASIATLAACALILGMGWHTGAYLTYFIHLALVPLCVCAAIASRPGPREPEYAWIGLLMLANLALLMAFAPGLPKEDRGWADLAEDVRRQPGLVVVDALMEPLSRGRGDVVVADTGIVRYAIDEARAIGRPCRAASEALAEAEAWQATWSAWMTAHRPDAIYLDHVALHRQGGRPGELSYVLRNGLAWYAGGYMKGYVPARVFHIHPFYLATNERRQFAGTWETLVIKFVPEKP